MMSTEELARQLDARRWRPHDRRMEAAAQFVAVSALPKMPVSVQTDQPAGVHLVLAGPEVIVAMAAVVDGQMPSLR